MPTSIPSLPPSATASTASGASASAPSLVDAFATIFGSSAGGAGLSTSFAACLPGLAAPKEIPAQTAGITDHILSVATDARSTPVHSTSATKPAKSGSATKSGERSKLSRDQIETVAALLAPLLVSVQSTIPAAGPLPGISGSEAGESSNLAGMAEGKTTGVAGFAVEMPRLMGWGGPIVRAVVPEKGAAGPSADPATNSFIQATISTGDDSVTVKLPTAWPAGSGADSRTTVRQALSAELGRLFGHSMKAAESASGEPVPSASDSAAPLSITVQMPLEAVSSVAATTTAGGNDQGASLPGEDQTVENLAGSVASISNRRVSVQSVTKKDFQVLSNQSFKNAKSESGIDGAKPARIMSDFSTDRRNPANPMESVFSVHPRGQSTEVSAPSREENDGSSGAPLAHRAVTTVLNVVNAQDIRPSANGVVNLHFKFGSDDLSVRVAMRGDEVHTQFSTDSAELRNALATEWRGVAGGNGDTGLRLVAPTFSSNGSSDQQLGSGAQGNSSQRDFSQQHSAAQLILPAASAFTGESAPADTSGHPMRMTGPLHTSLHLAAVA